MSKNMSFTDKEIRKYEKKSRQAVERYTKTNNTMYFGIRDAYDDKVKELKRNKRVNQKNTNDHKTDDQLINEAMKQNRIERFEREKEASEKQKKRQEIINLHLKHKERIKEEKKQEKETKESFEKYRNTFITKYMEENPKSNEIKADKEFYKHYNLQMQQRKIKMDIMNYFIEKGLTPEEAEQQFNLFIQKMNSEKDNNDNNGNNGESQLNVI